MRWPSAISIGCLLGAMPAGAGNATFHGTASGSVAATDNETGAETGTPGRRGGLFTDVRPGMLLTYSAPRIIHELVSEVDFLYTLGAERPSVTFRGGWKAFLLPSPRSELTLGAEASAGQLNALSASRSPDTTPTQVVPLGRVDTRNVVATQHLSWVASEFSRIWQRGFSRYTTTHDINPTVSSGAQPVDTEAFEVGGALGFDRRLRKNNFVFELGGSFLHLERLDPSDVQMGSRLDRQLNPRGVVIWQYDIDRKWSTNVDAGAVWVRPIWSDPYNPGEERRDAVFPIFGVLAAYTDAWGRATLTARRSVTPNLFIARNTVADSVVAVAAMPLTFLDQDARRRAPRVVGIGTLGLDRTRLIDPLSGTLQGQFDVARIDFGVGWSPRPGQTFGVRYELAYQRGDTVAEMVVPTFFRNTLYFTFALRYPEDVQVRVPRRNQSVRADRGDLAPIGAEPVIVDPTEFLEGGSGG